MAERKHVINLHTSTGVDAPSGASLYLGEIAVQHTPDNPALWIKMGTSEDSEIYEKFIGLTEITNIINQNNILGSGYTYSGLPYVNSSTTIADAYSALTKELIDDELVVSAALNELNDKIDQISGDTSAYDDLLEYIQEDEEVIAGALNVLNERVGVVETHMTGDYIPLTGYELASGTTEEELIIGDEDTVNEAFGKIQKQMLDNEEAVAAGLNDLNQRVEANTEAISHNTGVTVLSGVVRSLVNEVEDIWNEFEDYTPTGATEELSGVVQSISAKTSGVLTINVNGEEQGKYSPSADTTVNLEVIQDITGADVLLTGYELATGETEEELAIVATDTVNEAFGKLQKQNYDNEAVTAGALNDLDERLRVLESESGSSSEDLLALSAAVETFSAAVIDNEYVISSALNDLNDKILEISGHTGGDVAPLSAAVITLSGIVADISGNTGGDYEPLSAATHAHVTNNDIHVTAAQKTFWTNGANSGASAYTAVTALSAATTAINNTLTTVSGAAHNKITALSAATTAINNTLTTVSGAADSKITALSAATTGINSNLTALSAATTALTAASANYFDGAEYVSSAKTIIFTNNGTKKGEIDATAFIKDGMVSSVTIVGENMVISFNTDAGREDITLALTDIFDPDNYYNKTDIDNGVSASTKALSAGTVAHINDTDIHVTSAEKSAWFSGASAYTMVSALSASVITLSAITEENELIVATALNDMNDRVSALEAVSGAGADLSALSASVVTNKSNVETLSGAVVNQARVVSASLNELNDRVDEVSGSVSSVSTRVTQTQNALTSHTANTNIHVTAAEKTTWNNKQDTISDISSIRNNALSGASAYTAVTALSAATTGINNTLTTVSGAAHSKITALSAATTGMNTTLTAHTGNNNIHVTASEKTNWTNGANSGVSAYTGYTTHSAKTITSRTSSEMHLPAVTASDNGKILRVVNGAWALVDPTTIYTGSGQPSSDLGTDGDIYLQTS